MKSLSELYPGLEEQISKGVFSTAKQLMDEDPSIARKMFAEGEILLHYAIEASEIELARELVLNGANINHATDAGSSLHYATNLGDIEFVRFLLEQGADPNLVDWSHNTPLHLACDWGKMEIIRLLLKYGADPDVQNVLDRVPGDQVFFGDPTLISKLLMKYRRQ